MKARSGQRVDQNATQEMRYATVSTADQSCGSVQKNRGATTAPKKEGEKSDTAPESSKANRATPGAAVNFEVRKLGVSIECEPFVPNDEIVELNHVVECVTYPGDLKTPGAGTRYAPQPIFQTRKITTSQGVPVGRRVLVGTLNPPAADGVADPAGAGRVYLLFVRATPNEP